MGNKSLAKNSIYNVLYRCLNIIFPFVTSVYVARVLMADSIGKVAAAQNIVSYFTLLAAMGIPTYGIKLIAQFEVKSDDSSKAFSELFVINFILSVVCSVIYYSLIFLVPYFDGKELLYAVTGLNIVFNIINVDWFYQGIQEYGYIAIRSLFIKVVSLLALVFFVRNQNDYLFYALINTMALVLNYLFNIVRLRKYVKFSVKGINPWTHIKPISTLFIATIAAEVYVLADTTMLDVMCENSIVGYYSMSMRIIKIVRTLVVAVSAVFLPQMSYYYYNGEKEKFYSLMNRGLHILTVLSFPVAVGLCLVSKDAILLLFGAGFTDSIVTTSVLSVSIITVAFSNYIGMQVLVTLGKEKITTISTICGAIINITLNSILIPQFQHNGAAVASVITEAAVMMIQVLLARKYIKFNFGVKTVFPSVIVMGVVVIAISILPIPIVFRLILECFLGAVCYLGISVIMKDTFVMSVLGKFVR